VLPVLVVAMDAVAVDCNVEGHHTLPATLAQPVTLSSS
jgi:hypothetical protein